MASRSPVMQLAAPSGRRAGWPQRPVVLAACLGTTVLLFCLRSKPLTSAAPTCPTSAKTYGVMFDAGSTGSRVHVYQFSGEKGDLTLEDELFEQVKPGLSGHYKNSGDPKQAAQSLVPLLDKALARVPEDQRPCVPIALKATAGLRLLGQEKSDAILEEVRRIFDKSAFHLANPQQDVSLMGGSDEAIYGWMTVNFLLSNLGKQQRQTAAIIDMGGGSTQIVFEPGEAAFKSGPPEAAHNLHYNGRTFRLYEKSHLGYGLMEAQKKMGAKGGCSKEFQGCYGTATEILQKQAQCSVTPCSFNGVWQPPLSEFQGDIFAFSYYYDRMENHLPADGRITVGSLKEVAGQECPKAAENECGDLAYLYSVVHDGYDLPDTKTLNVKKKINGIETAWTLGAILTKLDKR